MDENVDENLTWLTQKTEDSKSNKENLTFLPHTVNVIELNCKVVKKSVHPPFLQQCPLFQVYSPFLAKICNLPPPPPLQVTQFLEGPTLFNKGGGGVQL